VKIVLAFFLTFLSFLPPPAFAADAPIATASLLSDKASIAPGQPFRIGLRLSAKSGWHTYWENPGDAGLATTLEWTLPEGFAETGIDWPSPTRIEEGPLVVYAYDSDIFLPVTFTPPETLDGASYSFHVKANWLICENICIPESAELDITLPVGTGESAADVSYFAAYDATKPIAIPFPIDYNIADKHIILSVPLSLLGTEKIDAATFFPRQSNVVKYASPQPSSVENGNLIITAERSGDTLPSGLSGLLQIITGNDKKTFDIRLEQKITSSSLDAHAEHAENKSFAVALLFALIGGLILNLMPCVLPVLSLKALALVKKAGGERGKVRMQGLAYTFGILLSFAAFAGVLLALKAAGQAVGWGFQMQSPAFVGFLIYLLFLVGLSLSGVFHLPILFGTIGASIANEDSARGSFFTGVLATAVATPCTAPFMASAVGAAIALPGWQAMLIFLSLGLGLALPFLLVSLFPIMLKFLPKPGAWMETFKHILAVPMYLSVLWLLWVLWQQTGTGGVITAVVAMAIFTAALFAKKFIAKETIQRASLLIIFVFVLGGSLPWIGHMEKDISMPATALTHDVDAVLFSKEKLDELRAANKPVFLDATAAWCITCQVNARVAIHTDATMKLFKEKNITLMVADWTRRNPEITELLASFGFQGVPMVVYYPAKGEPVVLPQLLSESIIKDAVQ
jgi:thiol:disulfide interchange protein